jgi:hypothetical protein
LNVEFDIQYLSRVILHKQNLSNNKLMFRIKCSIISISIIKYHFFRRLFYIDIKNKELRQKIVRCRRICSQEEICDQKEICSQEEICNQERICVIKICNQKRIYNQDFFIFKNARKLIKSDRIVSTKKRELRSSSAFFFSVVKINFSSTENQHFWKERQLSWFNVITY